jgi:hypothetical protein
MDFFKSSSLSNLYISEQSALLKLLIQISYSDEKFTDDELETIETFLNFTNLKISSEFTALALSESMEEILQAFKSKYALTTAYSTIEKFATSVGIDPKYEGAFLENLAHAVEERKKQLKPSLTNFLKKITSVIKALWSDEAITPRNKALLAFFFTSAAIILGSLLTKKHFFSENETVFVFPVLTTGVFALLIYGALAVRNFLPAPNSPRNILMLCVDVYLFSVICMHIIGTGTLEKSITIFIFFALILLMWLGIKEVLGFVFVAMFILLFIKLLFIDSRFGFRGLFFVLTAFLGLCFQSENFFDEFKYFSKAFFKKNAIEREMVKESVNASAKVTAKAVSEGISVARKGAMMASGMPPI